VDRGHFGRKTATGIPVGFQRRVLVTPQAGTGEAIVLADAVLR
jgi:hypothetical protein